MCNWPSTSHRCVTTSLSSAIPSDHTVDLKLEGGWLGHQTRMFNMLVLEVLLSQSMSSLANSADPVGVEHEAEKTVLVADLTKAQREISYELAGKIPSKEFYDVPIFACPRSQAMLQRYQDDDDSNTMVACSATGMGQFIIATMARFLVCRDEEGGSSTTTGKLVLLNGFVRVYDEPRYSSGSTSDEGEDDSG